MKKKLKTAKKVASPGLANPLTSTASSSPLNLPGSSLGDWSRDWPKNWLGEVALIARNALFSSLLLLAIGYLVIENTEVDWSAHLRNLSNYTFDPRLAAPEPAERRVYQLALLLVPTSLLGLSYFFRQRTLTQLTLWIFSAASLTGFLSSSGGDGFFYWHGTLAILAPWLFFPVWLGLSEVHTRSLLVRKSSWQETLQKIEPWATLLLALASAAFLIGGFFLRYIPAQDPLIADNHFEAVFFSSVQVTLGKTLLVDFAHQYGLYPEFLAPWFKLLGGIRVGNFSLTLAALQTAVNVMWLATLLKIMRRRWLALLLFLSTFYFSQFSISWHILRQGFLSSFDPYFQYLPIRALAPAFSIFAITHADTWNLDARRWGRVSISALLGLGIFWNLDAGLPAAGAWLLTLGYRELMKSTSTRFPSSQDWIAALLRGLEGLAAMLLAGLLFILYLKTKAGSWPDITRAIDFQKQFYLTGFFMLPMKLNHSWVILAGIWILAMSACTRLLVVGPKGPATQTLGAQLFGLVILGAGLFSYYQGRSHDWNFPAITPTGFVLIGILLDRLLLPLATSPAYSTDPRNAWAESSTPAQRRWASVLSFGVLLSLATPLLWSQLQFPYFLKSMEGRWFGTYPSSPVTPAVEYLKSRVKAGDSITLLSQHGGVYHAETQTRSALPQGLIELFWVEDRTRVLEQIKNSKRVFADQSVLQIQVQNTIYENNAQIVKALKENFRVVGSSPNQYLVEFESLK
jgi:hypothetical protein